MERNWPRAIAEVLASEGGYVNNPKDPGGPTNRGITLSNFRRYLKPNGTIDDLKAMSAEQAAVVFKKQYWSAVMGADLPDGVDYCVFDFAVNSGDDRAERLAQRIAGAGIDGQIGTKTLERIHSVAPAVFVNQYCDARLHFLRGLSTWSTFGKGWAVRVEKVRTIALQMVGHGELTPPVQIVEKPVEVEKPVAIIPKGSDKRNWLWWPAGGLGLSGLVQTFTDLPAVYKIGVGVATLALVVILLILGDRIIRRVKVLRDEINAG